MGSANKVRVGDKGLQIFFGGLRSENIKSCSCYLAGLLGRKEGGKGLIGRRGGGRKGFIGKEVMCK
jgi:hypothetical protein